MTRMQINKTISSVIKNHPLLVVLMFSFLLSVFSLPASVSAASGSDSNSVISSELCEVTDDQNTPNSSAQRENCREQIETQLDQCEVTEDPATPNSSPQRINCRQQVIDTNTPGSGGAVTTPDVDTDCTAETLTPENCAIIGYIRIITDALSVLVGVVVVMMLVVGGIQYSSAGSNPQAVQAAKKRISQALFALFIYIFMAAFLQWLVPGGVF